MTTEQLIRIIEEIDDLREEWAEDPNHPFEFFSGAILVNRGVRLDLIEENGVVTMFFRDGNDPVRVDPTQPLGEGRVQTIDQVLQILGC